MYTEQKHGTGGGVIYVAPPPGLEELVPDYLSDRQADLLTFQALLASGEFDKIRALAHNMKGTGSSYGFVPLTELGAVLEAAAKLPDEESVARHVSSLADYLGRVRLRE